MLPGNKPEGIDGIRESNSRCLDEGQDKNVVQVRAKIIYNSKIYLLPGALATHLTVNEMP